MTRKIDQQVEALKAGPAFTLETMRAVLTDANTALEVRDELLSRCARQFRYYERNHMAKGTGEGNEKALVNRRFAEEIEKILKEREQS